VAADELASLAAAGGSAVVAAMATDAWRVARDGIAEIFHRLEPRRRRAIEGQLDDQAMLVEHAADPEAARNAVRGAWILALDMLLREHPAEAGNVGKLVEQILEQLPQAGRTRVQTQFVIATDQATSFGVQGSGSLHVHNYHGDVSDESGYAADDGLQE